MRSRRDDVGIVPYGGLGAGAENEKTDCAGGGRHRPTVRFLRRLRPLIAFHIWRAALPARGSLVGDGVYIVGGFFIGLVEDLLRVFDDAPVLQELQGAGTLGVQEQVGGDIALEVLQMDG